MHELYRLWDSSRSCVPHTSVNYKQKLSFSFTNTSHMKTIIGAAVLQDLFKTTFDVSWPGKHFAWLHSLGLTSTIALFLYYIDKDAELLHNYHFILLAMLYTHARCKRDQRKESVIKFSDLLSCLFSFKFKLSDSSTPSSILKI